MKLKSILTLSALLLFQTVAAVIPTESKETIKTLCPFDELAEPAQTKADRLAIETVMTAWETAVLQVDFDTLGSLVTVDAEFWTHGAEPLVGREALIAAFKTFLAQYEVQQNYNCKELVIGEDWAFIRGLEVNSKTNKTTGEVTINKQRAFSVLKKDDQGQWRFARGMTNRPPED